jgi:hypothetical protein
MPVTDKTGILDLGSTAVRTTHDPSDNADLTNKAYVDQFIAGLVGPSYVLGSPTAGNFRITIDTDGALVTTASTLLAGELVLADTTGQAWEVTVNDVGSLETATSSKTPGELKIFDEDGVEWDVQVTTGGSLDTESRTLRIQDGQLQLYNPDSSGWHPISVRGADGSQYLSVGDKV